MGVTVHYEMPAEIVPRGNTPTDEPCAEMIAKALVIAKEVLDSAGITYEEIHKDDRNKEDLKHFDHYGFHLMLSGIGKGSEWVSYGWSYNLDFNFNETNPRDIEHVSIWHGRQFTKTMYALDFPKTHKAVVKIVKSWKEAGLVDYMYDEASYSKETGELIG